MKALVISDTHGYIDRVVSYIQENKGCFDEVWHLGDCHEDALALKRLTGVEVLAVKGNCDPFSKAPEQLQFTRMGKKILLTHGHTHRVKQNLISLGYYCEVEGIDLVCFGHTHEAMSETHNQTVFFNPGSPSRPIGLQPPQIGLVSIGETSIHVIWEKL